MRAALCLRVVGTVASGLAVLVASSVSLRARGLTGPAPRGVVRPVGAMGGGAEEHQPPVPTLHVVPPVTEKSARTWAKLQQPFTHSFPRETPLADVLKTIRQATKGKDDKDKGVPIYVDPAGLQEAEKTMTSPVTFDVEDATVALALKLMLHQLGLIFQVNEDGLVAIAAEANEGSPRDPDSKAIEDLESLRAEIAALRGELAATPREKAAPPPEAPAVKKAVLRRVAQAGGIGNAGGGGLDQDNPVHAEAVRLAVPLTAKAARTWHRLQEPVAMSFPNETPLLDVLKYIKSATEEPGDKGLVFYVDPLELGEAEKTMDSPVAIDIEGVPLATSLGLLLKQLGLKYDVLDEGIVRITAETDENTAPPSVQILNTISAIRMDVAEIRRAVATRREARR